MSIVGRAISTTAIWWSKHRVLLLMLALSPERTIAEETTSLLLNRLIWAACRHHRATAVFHGGLLPTTGILTGERRGVGVFALRVSTSWPNRACSRATFRRRSGPAEHCHTIRRILTMRYRWQVIYLMLA